MNGLDLSHFRHKMPLQIRFADLDALGHVNNAVYLTYMEQARIRYIRELGLWDGSQQKTGLIMAKAVVDYKLPLNMDDQAVIYTRCARLGNKSLEVENVIVRIKDGQQEIAAQGTIVLVTYDYQTNQSVIIPDVWRERLQVFEAGQL